MAPPKKVLGPVDPDVKIPPAVLAASAAADQLHAAAYATPPAEGEVVEPPVPALEPAPAPAPEPAPAPAPAPAPVSDQSWEHRYNSMKGRHDRLELVNKGLNDRLTGLEATLAAMSAAPAPPAAPATSLISAQETEQYGAEFLDVVRRAAGEKVSPEVAALRAELDTIKNQVGNVGQYVAQDAASRMYNHLNTVVPDWKALNDSEKFKDWLALPDTYSGDTRHHLLTKAHSANDGPRVAAFFQGFLASEAAAAPQPEPAPTPAPAPAKVPLAELAAPGRAKSAAAQSVVPAEKPIITSAQVTKFYSDVSRGAYRGKDQEKADLEKMIHDAGREGRIRP